MTKAQQLRMILELYEEVERLPIDGSFSAGSRGHLKITIANIFLKLGFKNPYEYDPLNKSSYSSKEAK